jgi:hypothetical protein
MFRLVDIYLIAIIIIIIIIANFMNLNISKTRAITFSRKTNTLLLKYKLRDSYITSTDCIKDLGVSIDSKLLFHSHVDYIFFSIY